MLERILIIWGISIPITLYALFSENNENRDILDVGDIIFGIIFAPVLAIPYLMIKVFSIRIE